MEWTYRGMAINLAAGERFDGLFRVGPDGAPETRYHHSLAEAKADVDDRVAVAAKARHTDLAMPVIGDDGDTYVIRGLNRGSGGLLGGPDRSEVYYPTPVIQGLIEESNRLRARLTNIGKALHPVLIRVRGGGRIRAEEYDDRIKALTDAYHTAQVAAEDVVEPPR